MESFKIHSHACLEVNTSNSKLLVDPWLVGSCYWRSWWNYPPLKPIDFDLLNPDVIYITHVHWDHWHGPTLKKFLSKDVLVVTHDEPNKRSYQDLIEFGFKKIKILKHDESFSFGDIKITPYQFGLFLNDSALVIETPNLKILNANDCKIAGQSLEQIKRKYGVFDFALRSHSSANDRVCYKIKGSDTVFDDPDHYSRSFKLFMDNVKPKYAVPFASNHCHLHKDVYSFNEIINDPFILAKHLEKQGGLSDSKLKIMLSGDSWSTNNGFNINAENEKFFIQKNDFLNKYSIENKNKLELYYKKESKQRLTKITLKRFQKQLNTIPFFLKFKLKKWSFLIVLSSNEKTKYIEVFPYECLVKELKEVDLNKYKTKIYIPLIIFNDAVNMNMFHHSGISKRNKYIFENEQELKKWEILNNLLEKVELQVFPLRLNYCINFVLSYFRRWREILVYFQALIYLQKGYKIYDVEEKILSNK
jgi:UDP-MurNAc hydroxylase